jgi:RNA recognition motif-containing protein
VGSSSFFQSGFGFIQFSTVPAAKKAILSMNGKEVLGETSSTAAIFF